MHKCFYACVCIHACVCMHLLHVCTHTPIYVCHTHTHTHTHTYTYTHTRAHTMREKVSVESVLRWWCRLAEAALLAVSMCLPCLAASMCPFVQSNTKASCSRESQLCTCERGVGSRRSGGGMRRGRGMGVGGVMGEVEYEALS